MDTGQNVRYFQVEKCGFKTAKPQGKKNAVLIFKTAGKTKCGFKTARKKNAVLNAVLNLNAKCGFENRMIWCGSNH